MNPTLELIVKQSTSLARIMKLIDDGILVRNVTNDASPNWLFEMADLVECLVNARGLHEQAIDFVGGIDEYEKIFKSLKLKPFRCELK